MALLLNEYPYSDYQKINLDWLLDLGNKLKADAESGVFNGADGARGYGVYGGNVTITSYSVPIGGSIVNYPYTVLKTAVQNAAVNDFIVGNYDGLVIIFKVNVDIGDRLAGFNALTLTGPQGPQGEPGEVTQEEFNALSNWIGYTSNVFNSAFTTTHPSNWQIEQTGNNIVVTHLTQWESGTPRAQLNLSPGTYPFSAEYSSESETMLTLYNGETWVKSLHSTDTITIESGNTYYLRLGYLPTQGNSITINNITIEAPGGGVVGVITNELNIVSESSQSPIFPVSDTEKKYINPTTGITDVDSTYFHVATYQINSGNIYWITASTRWNNAYFAWYNGNTLVSIGTLAPAELTALTNYKVTAPDGVDTLAVAYHTQSVMAAVAEIGKSYTRKWAGKKWVCVGDSLTAVNIRTTIHYFDYVSQSTGISVVNMGATGTGYARAFDGNGPFYQRISDCPTDADVVTIFGSFNDLGAGLSIGSVDDTGTTTLAGCINTTIDNLQAVIPLVNLGIVAPTPWDTTQPATSGQAYNYVEMLKAICERRSIPFLDLWRCSNLRPWDSDFRAIAYSKDGGSGTHPDENGHKLIAPRFEAFLDSLLLH